MYFIFIHCAESENRWGRGVPDPSGKIYLVSASEKLFSIHEKSVYFPVGNLAIYIFVNACLFKKELIKGKHRS